MPGWLKIMLIVAVACVVLGVVAAVAGFLWFRAHAGELRERAEAVRAEARELGASSTPDGCVGGALRRLDSGRGILDQAMAQAFLGGCLEAAPADPRFCEGVPARSEIMASVRWALGRCAELGRADDQACARILGEVQSYCHPSQ